MKKIFSFLALLFVLSSFGSNSMNEIEFNKSNDDLLSPKQELLSSNLLMPSDCFDYAEAMADAWLNENPNATWSESVPVFDDAMAVCEALELIGWALNLVLK